MPGSSSSESTYETPAEKLREVVAGWIDVVASQGERAIDAIGRFTPGKPWFPNVDVIETEDKVVVRVDVPGVDPAKVDVVLLGNMLTIKADNPAPQPQKAQTVHTPDPPPARFSP